MVYLLPFLSYLAVSKRVSTRPSDLDTMTNNAQEAKASSSGKKCRIYVVETIDNKCQLETSLTPIAFLNPGAEGYERLFGSQITIVVAGCELSGGGDRGIDPLLSAPTPC